MQPVLMGTFGVSQVPPNESTECSRTAEENDVLCTELRSNGRMSLWSWELKLERTPRKLSKGVGRGWGG